MGGAIVDKTSSAMQARELHARGSWDEKITSTVTELDSRVHFGQCIHESASYGHRAR
jgi:hypothetical protein